MLLALPCLFSSPVRLIVLLLLVIVLAACATRSEIRASRPAPAPGQAAPQGAGHAAGHGPPAAWPLAALAAVERPRIGLRSPSGERWLDTAPLRHAWAAAVRVQAVVPEVRPGFVVVDGDTPNAFALRHDDGDLVAITVGMVGLLGDDEAVWAALIGHELAHITLRHRETRQQRRQDSESAGAIVGILLTAIGLPLAPLFADAASAVAEKGYSRDDERAADEAGIAYMQRAGYAPDGAVRLFDKLGGAAGTPLFSFLSTHPGSAERLAAARVLAQQPAGISIPGAAASEPQAACGQAPGQAACPAAGSPP